MFHPRSCRANKSHQTPGRHARILRGIYIAITERIVISVWAAGLVTLSGCSINGVDNNIILSRPLSGQPPYAGYAFGWADDQGNKSLTGGFVIYDQGAFVFPNPFFEDDLKPKKNNKAIRLDNVGDSKCKEVDHQEPIKGIGYEGVFRMCVKLLDKGDRYAKIDQEDDYSNHTWIHQVFNINMNDEYCAVHLLSAERNWINRLSGSKNMYVTMSEKCEYVNGTRMTIFDNPPL